MELRGVSLKRVRTYFCESPILGEWVKQPLFSIIGSRCSQKWLLISLLRVFEYAYRKSFSPSPTLSEAKSRFILGFWSIREAKSRFIFGFPSVRKAKSRFIFGFLSVRRAKSQFIFCFTESPGSQNESRFCFTEYPGSQIAIHFCLAEYPEIKIEIHFQLRIVFEDQKRDSFPASWSDWGLESGFVFHFIEWLRIRIDICFQLRGKTGNQNQDLSSDS